MDAYTLERYFLQVGRSYYNSSDFNQFRVQLRKRNFDFAPVSEFGIGFLSTFLLADHVEVETAMWEPLRGDTAKRLLQIDGPTRLIRLDEQRNDGAGRFKGTRITLFLTAKISRENKMVPASWDEINRYLKAICQDLPYRLNLEHVSAKGQTKTVIDPLPLVVKVPPHLESATLRIPVDDKEFGLEGEIALINPFVGAHAQKSLIGKAGVILDREKGSSERVLQGMNSLLRGGFHVGILKELPSNYQLVGVRISGARLRLTWSGRTNKRYLAPNLARNGLPDLRQIEQRVLQLWLTHFLRRVDGLPKGQVFDIHQSLLGDLSWLEEFSALTIYKLARQDWVLQLRRRRISETTLKVWESGGQPILYSFSGLGRDLLDLIMPKVTKILLKKDGNEYIVSPPANWQLTLEACCDFISVRTAWGEFVDYDSDINEFLYYDEFGEGVRLNAKYRTRFRSWTKRDIFELRMLLAELAEPYTGVRDLSGSDSALFRRALPIAGDLKIGSAKRTLTLRSIDAIELRQ